LKDWKIDPDPDARPVFPPNVVIQIKALACELPCNNGIPLSRLSTNELVIEAINRGITAQISGSTVWRWLNEDAIKPWQYRSWIFPRDPEFEQKAGRVLDLYQGICKDLPCDLMNMLSVLMKKPVFKPEIENMYRYPQ
jgi:hypothetical protein